MMAKQPRYRSFTRSKKDGGERHIETPFTDLKRTQSTLSHYLQSTYYFEKSSSAYGFIVGVRNLVFYNYLYNCFVLIELKTGILSHQDVGQLDMYVRLVDEKWRQANCDQTQIHNY